MANSSMELPPLQGIVLIKSRVYETEPKAYSGQPFEVKRKLWGSVSSIVCCSTSSRRPASFSSGKTRSSSARPAAGFDCPLIAGFEVSTEDIPGFLMRPAI